MIKPCGIQDVSHLATLCEPDFGENAIMWVRNKMYDPYDKIFIFDETSALFYESFGLHKYCIHLIGSTKNIKGYKNFVRSTSKWIFENTNCKSLIALAPESNKRLQRFCAMTGAKRSGIITGSGKNGEDEILYSFPKYRICEVI